MSAASSVAVPGARHTVAPAGIAATAWPKVKQTCQNIGWRFDPWQDATGRLILAKNDTGGWAADLSILSIPRQVGKSYLLGCIIFALCLLNPRLRVIWTSHHTATTEEMYDAMKELAAHKRVAPHVVKCVALQGSRWRIQFRNGSRIDFGARSQGFGRGKARVGILVLDEFQHITARALTNLTPTTNTADNPLILCAGTPPAPEANGSAFAQRRKAALEGLADDSLYIEFSADRDADIDDRRQWAKANPSFPKRTRERAFLLNRKILTEADFRRDMLGIWDEMRTATGHAIPLDVWKSLEIPDAEVPGGVPDRYALAMSPERIASIAVAVKGEVADYLDLAELERVDDSRKLVDWLVERCGRRVPVLIDSRDPAASYVNELRRRGVKVNVTSKSDAGRACGGLLDAVLEGRVWHCGQPALAAALVIAEKREFSKSSLWEWDLNDSTAEVAALRAVTLAHYGLSFGRKTKQGSGRKVVTG